jgi:hypothetical protein
VLRFIIYLLFEDAAGRISTPLKPTRVRELLAANEAANHLHTSLVGENIRMGDVVSTHENDEFQTFQRFQSFQTFNHYSRLVAQSVQTFHRCASFKSFKSFEELKERRSNSTIRECLKRSTLVGSHYP